MARETVGTAGRADGSDEIEIRIPAPASRCYRVLADDAPRVLAGWPAILYDEEGAAVGDIESSASLRMLVGASRAGLGFVAEGETFPVEVATFMIPRDHLRAHYYRHDGPVEVLARGD